MSYLNPAISRAFVESIKPSNESYEENLRFYCQTSLPSDPSLDFMASMWSFSIARGGLTGKQQESAHKYISARIGEVFIAYPTIGIMDTFPTPPRPADLDYEE